MYKTLKIRNVLNFNILLKKIFKKSILCNQNNFTFASLFEEGTNFFGKKSKFYKFFSYANY